MGWFRVSINMDSESLALKGTPIVEEIVEITVTTDAAASSPYASREFDLYYWLWFCLSQPAGRGLAPG